MSLLARFAKTKTPGDLWQPVDQAYPSLFDLKTHTLGLTGKGGVYALWHLGVRPQWLHIGAGPSLGVCLASAATALVASPWRGNGGLYAAWVFMDSARWPGIVQGLRSRLAPALQDVAFPEDAVWDPAAAHVVFPLPPGTTER